MTDKRLNESAIGLAGRLSHIPYGTDKAEHCGWQYTRKFTRNAPVFRPLGPCRTWIPAEPGPVPESLPPLGTAWEQSQRQRRWLLKCYPEASLGNNVLHEYLMDEEPPLPPQQERSSHLCLFSFGELTDTSSAKASGAPLVATVTGTANNVLRLAKLDQERWSWSRQGRVAVRLGEVAMEEPTLWISEDVGPIHRVKCIVDSKRYNPTRWLAVQRDSGTTIFQPEYSKGSPDVNLERDASRIAPNPLFRLSKEQTGGNPHSDVSFNPGTRSHLPQLAIIDERGFWSVWDVANTRTRHSGEAVSRLKICGHIDRGVLIKLPRRDLSVMRWHKVLWVGRPEDSSDLLGSLDLDADSDELGSQAAFPPLQRSPLLLVYNSQQVRLIHLATGFSLPELQFTRLHSQDRVLDIQSTHDPQYFYVLTTSRLFIVRVYTKPGLAWDKPEKEWLILFSTPHFRSSFDHSLKLAITQGSTAVHGTSLVFIYSSVNSWLDLFYVEFSSNDPNAVRCQPNVAGLGRLQNSAFSSTIQSLCIRPTPVIVNRSQALTKTETDLAEKRVRLYQIVALGSDMSLASTLCGCSFLSSVQISLPTERVSRLSRAERERRKLIKHPPSSKFVVSDEPTISRRKETRSTSQRFVKVFYEHLNRISASRDEDRQDAPSGKEIFGYNPFDAVHFHTEEAINTGLVPVRTLLQIMPKLNEASRASLPAIEWEAEVSRLNNIHPNVTVLDCGLLRSRLGLPRAASVQEAYSELLDIVNSSLYSGGRDDANEENTVAISQEIAYDLYLSIYSVGYRNPRVNKSRVAAEEEAIPCASQMTLPSSPPRLHSPASTPLPTVEEEEEVEDPAIALLRAYTGTGKFVPNKKFELLDKWNLDAAPTDYAFDLDRSGDAEATKQRIAKVRAREDRKRRRVASLLQLSQEPDLPSTQPVAGMPRFFAGSSQPRFSSQRQIIHSDPLGTMSQPSTGAFGRRPAKKAKKRKGGF